MEILGGPFFSVAGAGESHGPAVTTIVLGCPPGIYLKRNEVQSFLDRRRPGGNKHGTPRNEKDKVVFLSGLFQSDQEKLLTGSAISVQVDGAEFQTEGYEEGYTTGEPIAAIVLSTSKKSGDYTQLVGDQGGKMGEVRPGHTDLVKFHQSGGFVDVRGGGRSSYRSTISDVVGGGIARALLSEKFGTVFLSSICQVGLLKSKHSLADLFGSVQSDAAEVEAAKSKLAAGEIASIDTEFASQAAELIKETRKAGDSIGACVEVVAVNVPALVGDPLYQSLKARLMGSLGGLNAVQSCEVGSGSDVISRTGSQNNDPIRSTGYQGNTHGGMIGGITTGMPIVMRVGFKPTSTIHTPQQSIRKNLEEIDFQLEKGRHDPCVGVRAGVTLESRMAIELANAVLSHQARAIDVDSHKLW
ncbi:Chorismate synthase [Rubripirellula obstinata]|uniref:Chorismate synthase n=1 Tax=Rubripirellula obstinata TaxID=406547 RepID=A0A5B1CKS5_9BACT|nr:chorismate synthase [Rubripirellula obstinata]KAA1260140.1 Chorismate synthase [Rubripirellula obstinata]